LNLGVRNLGLGVRVRAVKVWKVRLVRLKVEG
jgi:hypothetical protein